MDDGLFGPDSVTWRVHLEPVMWVGGLRALILQTLHPRVMRGTYQNSALFDPDKAWARFQRTAAFVGTRTYGTRAQVEAAAARVRALHGKLRGYDPDSGSTFRIDEPGLLLWVHCAEIDSYVDVARRAGIVDAAEADAYVAESVRAAQIVGLPGAPRSCAELQVYFARVRPELYLCAEGRVALRNLLAARMPAPLAARLAAPPIAVLAVATLPRWARRLCYLPGLPTTDLGATLALRALRQAIRLLPAAPAPPEVERARELVRSR
ncbi:hypothetical protein GCM10009609_38790 [Pseudonocardia aurantiaca]|uniref:Oxygenase MpaB family protein n=1 Tax=Pseudonocardia aurantiaca TaxID=75290 RepID=A0ABW4FQ50_9PSEU